MPRTKRVEDQPGEGRTARQGQGRRPHADLDFPKYSIAVAADLSGLPQHQLRRMEESGLVAPSRTVGNTRRYSENDLAQIAQVADLTDAGINAEGIRQVLRLEQEVRDLRAELADLRDRLRTLEDRDRR